MKRSKAEVQKRQKLILDYLLEYSNTDLIKIAKTFNISISTVRRDLCELDKRGDFNLIMDVNSSTESVLPQFDEERYYSSNIAEKDAIARCAAELIDNGDTIFINSSSTALRIFPYIKNKSVNIVTNNGRSLTAVRNHGTDLIILGGEAALSSSPKSTKLSMTGDFTIENINRIAATKCILGVSGISYDKGLTSMAIQDPPINRAMIRRCKGPVIILADHRKIGIEHNFHFGDVKDVTYLITDSKSNPVELQKLRNAEIKVILVDPDNDSSIQP
jgi:DeoR/GlpR family transcriptional regulator of sugar metabolism